MRDGVTARRGRHVQETILCPRTVPLIALAPAPKACRAGSVSAQARVRGRRADSDRRISAIDSDSEGHLPFSCQTDSRKIPFPSFPLTWERMRGGLSFPPSGGICSWLPEMEERKRVAIHSLLAAGRCLTDSRCAASDAREVRRVRLELRSLWLQLCGRLTRFPPQTLRNCSLSKATRRFSMK